MPDREIKYAFRLPEGEDVDQATLDRAASMTPISKKEKASGTDNEPNLKENRC